MQQIHFYIGDRLEHASERHVLRAVFDFLAERAGWAYVFANFNAGGRQIDVAVLTATTTLVIEAKGYTQPVQGGVNGRWMQTGPYGTRPVGNGYLQALGAKNALRDILSSLFETTSGYPNALVTVAPTVPKGSHLPDSDFKVAVGDVTAVRAALSSHSSLRLRADQCEALAAHLSLERVLDPVNALSDGVLEAQRLCDGYMAAIAEVHGPVASQLLEDEYRIGDDEVSAQRVQSMVFSSTAAVLVRGATGCGKSLLSAQLAVRSLQEGFLPIHVQGKDFEGKLNAVIGSELALMGVSPVEMFRVSRVLGKQLLLILDGYNECRAPMRATLTRSLRAFSLRYSASLLITSQEAPEREDLLSLQTVQVPNPTLELKSRLAGIGPEDEAYENSQDLLQVAGSGLEAKLIGLAAESLPVGASKFVLFDTVARLRLGAAASAGISLLSAFAAELVGQAAFSQSVREFDRFSSAQGAGQTTINAVLESRLLVQRGDRYSFSHEMFFAAFAAESAVRAAGRDKLKVGSSLRSPRLNFAKILIAGAIEDEKLLEAALDETGDAELLKACLKGECGAVARSVVSTKVQALLEEMVLEPASLKFHLGGEGWYCTDPSKAIEPSSRSRFSDLLPAIGWLLIQGQYLDIVMSACRVMDGRIAAACQALREEAREKKIAIGYETFSQAYVFNRDALISKLINFVHSGGLSFREKPGATYAAASRAAWDRATTFGEFYFLLGLTNSAREADWAALRVASLLDRFRSMPYHLQLAALHFCVYTRVDDEHVRARMTSTLEGLLDKLGVVMNSIIFDALKGLGGLESGEEAYCDVVREEIECALSPSNSDADSDSWRLFSAQFDHPYDTTYWEEIHALSDEKRKRLLVQACRGTGTEYASFIAILIQKLADFDDPEVGAVIEPWLRLPSKNTPFPQDALEAFFVAHEAFGKLGLALPAMPRTSADSETDEAMCACGELAYWSERLDESELEVSPLTTNARSSLLARAASVSAGALRDSADLMFSPDGMRRGVAQSYPLTALAICRQALRYREAQSSYYKHGARNDSRGIATYVIRVIELHGGADDLRALQALCDDEWLGTNAIRAIRTIEERVRYRKS